MRSGASQTLCTGGFWEQVLRIRADTGVILPYEANHSLHGGYSPRCYHIRGTLFHLPVHMKGRGMMSSPYSEHASITME
jgi:hypothetical protein